MEITPKLINVRKCEGTGCNFKMDCFRYMAEDIGERQLWLNKVPYKNQSCSTFAPLRIKDYFDSRNKHLKQDKGGE